MTSLTVLTTILIKRKLIGDYLSFKEKLSRPIEKTIAGLLLGFVSYHNSKDLTKFLELFSEEAEIESRSIGNKVRRFSKVSFREAKIKAFENVDSIFLDDISFLNYDNSTVVVHMILSVLLKNNSSRQDSLCLTFVLVGERWFITKNLYC